MEAKRWVRAEPWMCVLMLLFAILSPRPSQAAIISQSGHLSQVIDGTAPVRQNPPNPQNESGSVPIVVFGRLDLELEAENRGESIIVRGVVRDELSFPVRALIELHGPGITKRKIEPCSVESPPIREQLDVDDPATPTDSSGQFCLVTDLPAEHVDRFSVHATAQHYVPVEKPLAFSARKAPSIIRAPSTVDLGSDDPQFAEVTTAGALGGRASIELLAHCEGRTVTLDRQEVAPAQKVVFEFAPSDFPAPGQCELSASVVTQDPPATSYERPIAVRGHAQIDVVARRLEDDELVLELEVGGYGVPASSGLIEVRQRGAFVASVPVRSGRADLRLSRNSDETIVDLSYRPGDEYWQPGTDVAIAVPARAIAGVSSALHAAGLLGFFAWLVHAWVGRRKRRPQGSDVEPAGSAVLQNRGRTEGPIAGIVLDAHTGAPLEGADVRLLAPTATEERLLETSKTGPRGQFSFETRVESEPLLRLRVHSTTTMPFEAALQTNQLVVQVTERRRAAIGALVRWARGQAGFVRPPTPGEVEAEARRQRDPARGEWASAVAQAAYGPDYPSEMAIDELSDRESRANIDG